MLFPFLEVRERVFSLHSGGKKQCQTSKVTCQALVYDLNIAPISPQAFHPVLLA